MLRTRLACAALVVVTTLPGCRVFWHDGPGLFARCRAKHAMNAEPVSYPMTGEGAFPVTTVIPGPVISGPPIMQPAPYSPGAIPPQNIPPLNGGTLPPPTGQVPNKMPPSGGAGIKENPGKEFETERRNGTGPTLAVPVNGGR